MTSIVRPLSGKKEKLKAYIFKIFLKLFDFMLVHEKISGATGWLLININTINILETLCPQDALLVLILILLKVQTEPSCKKIHNSQLIHN